VNWSAEIGFLGAVDDAQRGEGGMWSFDAGEIEQAEAERFEQALFAAVQIVALLDGGTEVEPGPFLA
jgi:hypothetical protein